MKSYTVFFLPHIFVRTKNYNGFQRAMAMMFALDHVNKEVAAGRKKIALKGHIYDTCSNDISAIATVLQAMNEVVPAAGRRSWRYHVGEIL